MNTTRLTRIALRCLLFLAPLLAASYAHAMQLGVSLNPDRVRAGEVMMATLTVTNDSGATVSNAQVQAMIPATGVDTISPGYASGTPACSNLCDPTEYVTWTLGVLAPGQGVSVSIPLVVTSGTASGSVITLPARLLLGNVPSGNTVTRTVTVDNTSPLTLTLDVDKDGAAPGDTLVYALTYGNRSTTSVAGTSLSLPLPSGVTFVSASGGGTLGNGTVNWNLSTLQAGQAGRLQVVVIADAALASGALLEVQGAQITGAGGTLARAALVSRIQDYRPLGIAIALNADPARPGETITSQVITTNQSDGTLFNVVIRARMPREGVDTVSPGYLTEGASCSNLCDPSEFVTWTIASLEPGASISYSLAMVPTGNYEPGRPISLQAEAAATGAPMTIARHSITVDGDNALSLVVDANRNAVAPGERLVYDLVYGNRNSSSLSGVTLSLPLPVGVTLVSATGNGAQVGSVVNWNLPVLLGGQSGRQQVVVMPSAALASGRLLTVDAAQISGSSVVTGSESARSTLVTRVQATPPLGVAIAMNADPARPGETLSTTLTATNRSDQTIFNTTLIARMPTAGVDTVSPGLLSGSANCSNLCDATEFVRWDIGPLTPHASASFSLPMGLTTGYEAGRLISMEATVQADGLLATGTRHTIASDAANALSLTLTSSADSAAPGSRVTYTLTYGNRSSGSIDGTVLSFPVPEGATLVGSSSGTMTGQTVSWNLGSLVAGTGGQRTVTVVVQAGATAGWRLGVDAAQIAGTSGTNSPKVARATAVTRVMPSNPLVIAVTAFGPGPVLPGTMLSASSRVTNKGSTPLVGVVVRMRVPVSGANGFAPSSGSPGALCSNLCDPAEFVTWNIGTLASGASADVGMPLVVTAGTTPGRLITLDAFALDDNFDQSFASANVLVGSNFSPIPIQTVYGDFDGNGVVNIADLAVLKANFGTSNALCDMNGDGVVNVADLALFKSVFGL